MAGLKKLFLFSSSFWQAFVPKTVICFREKYSLKLFRSDLTAGLTVGIVALPLAMAFAIASGATPQQGLYTAIVAGFLISLLSGSRFQIGGPTGAFVVIVFGVIQRQGYPGLLLATFIAGLMLIVLALCRIGSWIKFIPYPLITGFTTGIATIIFSSQIKDFFGLKNLAPSGNFIGQWGAFFKNVSFFDPATLSIASASLALILLIRKYVPKLPWGITSIVVMTGVTVFFKIDIATIQSHFGVLKGSLSALQIPSIDFSLGAIKAVFSDAVTIALLAGIESLLCAMIADGMTGRHHKSNCELLGQGVANIASSLIGGLPVTGAIARTATNVRAGAKTPLAGMIHALTLLVIFLFLGPIVSRIPLACLSAVLMMVAWDMADLGSFLRLFKAPRGDFVLLLLTFLLTIFIDITVAVQVGMVFAAFLFVKRMSDHSKVISLQMQVDEADTDELKNDPDAISKKIVPPGVEVYEVTGPLFFAVVETLRDVLKGIETPPKVFILRMRKVSNIDASGMNSLEELYEKCQKQNIVFILSGVRKNVFQSLDNFGIIDQLGKENVFPHIDAALKHAKNFLSTP